MHVPQTKFTCLSFTFSTLEIKPNQTDIGRRITKKPSAIAPSAYRTTPSGQTSSTTPNSLTSNGKRPLDSLERGPSSGDGQQQQVQSSMSHLASQSATSSHSYNSSSSQDHHHDLYQHHNNTALNGVVGDDVDHQRSSSNLMGHNLSRNNGQQNHRNPDIMRKPIKWVDIDAVCLLKRFDRNTFLSLIRLQGKTYTLISFKAI